MDRQDKVEKIVFNLLSNAFKYTLPGKTVKITVQKSISISAFPLLDEGMCIASDKIGSLFKRFETLSKNNNILATFIRHRFITRQRIGGYASRRYRGQEPTGERVANLV